MFLQNTANTEEKIEVNNPRDQLEMKNGREITSTHVSTSAYSFIMGKIVCKEDAIEKLKMVLSSTRASAA